MLRISEGRTTFVIAHGSRLVQHADLILVLRDDDCRHGTPRSFLHGAGFIGEAFEAQVELAEPAI